MSRATRDRRAVRLRCESLEGREVPAILYAVTADQRLLTFDSVNPGVILGSQPLGGLSLPGEQITDIDLRPGSGLLYGRSGAGRVYLINTFTGGATLLGGGVTPPGEAGFDFNPRTDRIRVINSSGENVTVDPSTGSVASVGQTAVYVDGDTFAGVQPRISALAHTNSVSLASTTRLFGIDHVLNTLVVSVGSANGSQFATVGSLGIDVGQAVGFDIDPNGNVGYATFRVQGGGQTSYLAMVDLFVGSATVFAPIGGGPRVFDIAVAQTLTSAGTFPPAINPGAVGFGFTNIQASFNLVFPPPVISPPTFSPPPATSGGVSTNPLVPSSFGSPLTGSFGNPIGGLNSFGGPLTGNFGGSIGGLNSFGSPLTGTLGGAGSFVVSPPITFNRSVFSF